MFNNNKFWFYIIYWLFVLNLNVCENINGYFEGMSQNLKALKDALSRIEDFLEEKLQKKLEIYVYPTLDIWYGAFYHSTINVKNLFCFYYKKVEDIVVEFVNSSFIEEVYHGVVLSIWIVFIVMFGFEFDYLQFVFDFHVFLLVFYLSIYITFLTAFSRKTKREIGLRVSRHLSIWLYSGFILLCLSCFLFNFMCNKFFFFNGMYVVDSGSLLMKFWIIIFSIISVNLSKFYIENSSTSLAEMPVLFSVGICFSIFVLSVINLFAIIIIFEILSIVILGLCGLSMEKESSEASVKYFVQNAVITGFVIFGVFWTYFIFKSTNLLFIHYSLDILITNQHLMLYLKPLFGIGISLWLLGFFFKLGIFPANFYVPDMYEAASSPVLLFMSAVIKPAIFYVFIKIFNVFNLGFDTFLIGFITTVAIISMLLGDFMALGSEKIKRFLGYSSTSQYGFLSLVLTSYMEETFVFSLIYLFIYNIALIVISLVLLEKYTFEIKKERFHPVYFSELNFFLSNKLFLKWAVTFSFLIMSGIPPFILFYFKYVIFLTMFNSANYILMILLAVSSVLNITYYFRIIADIWVFDSDKRANQVDNKITFLKSYQDFELFYYNIFIFFTTALNIIVSLVFFIYFDNIYEVLMFVGLDCVW